MSHSQQASKDPMALVRGTLPAAAKTIKAEKKGSTPVKKEPEPRSTMTVKVDSLAEVIDGSFTIVNGTTGEKQCYENCHIPPVELTGMKRKLISGDEFLLEAIKARKKLKEDVFNSALSKEEISALDLEANTKLFPELVNRDYDLRKRPLRDHEWATDNGRFIKHGNPAGGETSNSTSLQAITSVPSRPEIIERLTEKARWFRDIQRAAAKQAEAYEAAAKEVRESLTNDDKKRDESRPTIPTGGIEAVLSEDISRLRQLSKDEWRSRQTALLSHVHAIAENYRQELSGFGIYVNKAIKTLDKTATSAAALLWHLSHHEVPGLSLDAWSISEASDGSHMCECDVCKGRATATVEQLGPIGVLRRDFEKSKLEVVEAKEFLLKEAEWEAATVAQPVAQQQAKATVELLEAKYYRWFLEREKTIENSHLASLKAMGETKSRIEWEMEARRRELESYEKEVEIIEEIPQQNNGSRDTSQLLGALEQCRRGISEDQKLRDASLDIEEFVELYFVPVEKREDWLVERCERDKGNEGTLSERMKAVLSDARKELQASPNPGLVEWMQPEEFQMLYEQLPEANIREMDRYLPLFKNKELSREFDFRSNEIWANNLHE